MANEASERLRLLTKTMSAGTAYMVKQLAESALQSATAAVPVDTGRLKNSLRVVYQADGLKARLLTDVPYARFVEFGTKYVPARPFLFPAVEAAQHQIYSDLSVALAQSIANLQATKAAAAAA